MRRGLAFGAAASGILLFVWWSWAPAPAGADPKQAEASADEGASGEGTSGEEASAEETSGEEATDPVWANAACYVCHMTFVREKLSTTHLQEKITCIKCHGLSAGHANDEDIGATLPDVTYRRDQVNAACRECHKDHDVPPEQVVARWLERERPAAKAICTDCHGMHKIEQPEEDESPE